MKIQPDKHILPTVVLAAIGLVCLAAWTGLIASDWRAISGPSWSSPSSDHWLGTNRIGQDVFARMVKSFSTALEVGLVVGFCSSFLGLVIGAAAGFYRGRWIDELLLWLMGCFEAIPYYLLIGAVLFSLSGLAGSLQLAMILSFWPAVARQARIRTIALARSEFILAGRVSGLTNRRLITRHVLPHLKDLFLVQASLLFVAAVKTEVVLSFVGLAGLNSISFGRMLAEAGQDLLAGQYMNFIAASLGLLVLIWSINRWVDFYQVRSNPRTMSSTLAESPRRQIEPV